MNTPITLQDVRPVPDKPHPYTAAHRTSGVPLIIDNGSYQCRAGWATDDRPPLEFRNLIAKPRRDRSKRTVESATAAAGDGANADIPQPPIQVGNDIANIEAMRFQLKTQFDRNVVTHLHNTEQIFDYVLHNLSVTGADNDGGLPHPVVLTEALANPNYSRQLMSELLFECYDVPRVAYGVDALFGFRHSRHPESGLCVSFGHHATHVIPVLGGRAVAGRARRLNLGGNQMIGYLHRLLQLKYPVHTAAITLSRAEWLLHSGRCTVAEHYGESLGRWAALDYYERHVHRVQLPFTVPAAASASALSAEQRVERRRESAKRLADMNARRREEKLVEDEQVLQRLVAMREMWEDGDREEFEYAAGQMEIAGIAELEKLIQTTHAKIHRTKARSDRCTKGTDPDAARSSAAAAAAAAAAAIPQPPGDLSIADWVRQTRTRRSDILERRQARRQRRQDLARRRTAAAQERMRVISQLARKEKGNDDFGARDADWDVYKTIRRETGDSDSEAEQERLVECEEVLRHHDPDFEKVAGAAGGGGQATGGEPVGAENPAESYQLHVGVEAIRCTEILFQPSLVGCAEAGLAEIIEFVLKPFTVDEQQQMVENVFMTGGCSQFPGLTERLTRELREMRPFQSTFHLSRSDQPSRDAWLGARQVASDDSCSADIYITRADYAEKGGDYLREHRWGNRFYATPAPIVVVEPAAAAAAAVAASLTTSERDV